MKKYQKLIEESIKAQKNAYAPYSNFKVGAGVLTESGKIYKGCNVENISYGLTNCAERNAIFSAISNGENKFEALAIYAETDYFTFPCGACRQVICEFNPEMDIILINKNKESKIFKAKDLLPNSFKK